MTYAPISQMLRMMRDPALPQGQVPRDGLQTDARKRQQIEAVLRSHVSLLCMGKRYVDAADPNLIEALMARCNGKWG